NLVFIQFNARVTRTEQSETAPGIFEEIPVEWAFDPLPAKHEDTGMGFERLCSFIQCTRNFTDFTRQISNYETDVFRPLFAKIEQLSGKKYNSTLPTGKRVIKGKEVACAANESEITDIAFRVIADHLRTVAFSIGDGVEPGNDKREYV